MSAPAVDHVPRLRQLDHYRQAAEHARIVAQAALDTGNALPVIGRHTPGDAERLRGVPVVGVPGGRSGAINGTTPGR